MTALRHQWADPNRFLHKTERVCLRCSLVKVTRHEGEEHWIEWWRDAEQIRSERTPVCAALDLQENWEAVA